MEPERIKNLLEAYWTGETSREEEAELRRFFSREEIPATWAREAVLFRYFQQQRGIRMPHPCSEAPVQKARPLWARRWMQAAAFVLIMTSAGAIWYAGQISREKERVLAADTFEDPEEAYEVLREALFLVSSKMNGNKSAAPLQQLKRSAAKLNHAADQKK